MLDRRGRLKVKTKRSKKRMNHIDCLKN
jgi:hypothetical protein